MTFKNKAFIIQLIIIIFSVIISIKLTSLFQSKGHENLAWLSTFILTIPFGLYILFGKYVYLCGFVTKSIRICNGLFFIFITPVIWLIYYLADKLR